jgi:hypothetical protein
MITKDALKILVMQAKDVYSNLKNQLPAKENVKLTLTATTGQLLKNLQINAKKQDVLVDLDHVLQLKVLKLKNVKQLINVTSQAIAHKVNLELFAVLIVV